MTPSLVKNFIIFMKYLIAHYTDHAVSPNAFAIYVDFSVHMLLAPTNKIVIMSPNSIIRFLSREKIFSLKL